MQRLKRCGLSPWVRKIPWRRAHQCTPVFLSGESHRRGVWQARVYRAAESWTRLKHDLTCMHMPDAPENNEYFQRQQDKGEVSLDFQGVEVHTLLYQKKYIT